MNAGQAAVVQERLNLDATTMARLEAYAALLVKWQPRINLVAPSTVPDLWTRHILDSAQLWPHIEGRVGPLLDLGSGAGFPGLVLAIMGRPDAVLVEADRRKAAFLQEAARVTQTSVSIRACRIEALAPIRAGIITARALASLESLLHYAQPYADESTVYLFLKGERAEDELTTARKRWKMLVDKVPSLTNPKGVVLRLEGVTNA